ncbi:MAG: hypothetical protein LC624_03010 [Halobacteriales archaeon]|nr:hypothetical protein [Halobacteriales archaeon]
MLAVLACPRCRHAKVCDSTQKTTTCGHCSAKLDLRVLRRHVETESADEAQRAAGLLNARLAGRLDAFLEEAVPVAPPSKPGDQATRVRKLARDLAALGPFDAQRFTAELSGAGLDPSAADEHLARLLAAGVLIEPRRGRYAAGPGS